MSVGVTSMPSWKQQLLEKKRRQDEEERHRREEEDLRMSRLPQWKREILLKKQQHRNSHIFIGRDAHHAKGDNKNLKLQSDYLDGHVNFGKYTNIPGVAVEMDEYDAELVQPSFCNQPNFKVNDLEDGPSEEHIPPIEKNPWLAKDQGFKRHHESRLRSSHGEGSPAYPGEGLSPNSQPSENSKPDLQDDVDNNVFQEEEEVYRPGFVSKLLSKFTRLSTNDHEKTMAGSYKKSQSTDSFLSDPHKEQTTSPRSLSSSAQNHLPITYRASSMERLSNHEEPPCNHVNEHKKGDYHGYERFEDIADNAVVNHSVDNDINEIQSDSVGEFGGSPIRRVKSQEDILEEGYPRPNTVLTARNIFESGERYDKSNKRSAPPPPRPSNISVHAKIENVDTRLENEKMMTSPRHEDAGSASIPFIDDDPKVNGAKDDPEHEEASHDERKHLLMKKQLAPRLNDQVTQQPWKPAVVSPVSVPRPYTSAGKASPAEPYRGTLTGSHSKASVSVSPKDFMNGNNNVVINGPASEHDMSDQRRDTFIVKKRSAPPPPVSTSNVSQDPEYNKQSSEPNPSQSFNNQLPEENKDNPVISNEDALKMPNGASRTKLYLDFDSGRSKTVVNINNEDERTSSEDVRDLYLNAIKKNPNQSSSQATQQSVVTDVPDNRFSISDGKFKVSDDNEITESHAVNVINSSKTSTNNPDIHSNGVRLITRVPLEKDSDSSSVNSLETGSTVSSGWSASVEVSSQSESEPAKAPREGEPEKPIVILRPKPESAKAERPNSIDSETSKIKLEDIKAAEAERLKNKNNILGGKLKRNIPNSSTGPGSLLIRPASNLVPSNTTQNNSTASNISITKYHDVTTGSFEPAKKRPSYYDDYEDLSIPITNIDDFDLDAEGSARSDGTEGDAELIQSSLPKKYDFIGGGVTTGKNLLIKTRPNHKLNIVFNDTATTTYEYPSEQSLLDLMPPEPGDFDYPTYKHKNSQNDSGDSEEVQPIAAKLISTPGLGSGGGLANYQSKITYEYTLGQEEPRISPPKSTPPPTRQEPDPDLEDIQVKPADDEETSAWSNSASSDLLF